MTIIVHGGAKEIPLEEHEAHRQGCFRASEAGWKVLQRGGSAIEAVEAAIRALEDDPTFNAGTGSQLNVDGEVQMDAAIIDGRTGDAGAVAYIQRLKHPISVSRMILDQKETFLVGDGARLFAEEAGAELCKNEDLVTPARLKEWMQYKQKEAAPITSSDTVGCVALDKDGNIAAGASTGGLGNHPRGRVGDTPQIGCGVYADNGIGGCSNTGDGEAITRAVLAYFAVNQLDGGFPPEAAALQAMHRLKSRQGDGGCIIIDKRGRIGWNHNSPHIAVAYRTTEMRDSAAFIQKQDERQEAAA